MLLKKWPGVKHGQARQLDLAMHSQSANRRKFRLNSLNLAPLLLLNPVDSTQPQLHQGRLMLGGSAHEHIGEAKQTNELHKQENDI